MSTTIVDGPFFEDLVHGQIFDRAPSVTITPGLASAHQAIVGNRLQVSLDEALCSDVVGSTELVCSPALVWDISIGQSTEATHRVVANLNYRNLAFHRAPVVGDTLTTRTTVIGLRRNRPKEGRAPTGLVQLHIITVDQGNRLVLDFVRCAMVSCRSETNAHDSTQPWTEEPPPAEPSEFATAWNLTPLREKYGRVELEVGDEFMVLGGDVVSSAPELARLTQNVAKVHHDGRSSGGRLVYGGHTIGLALHQVLRALPSIATVTKWSSCDHLSPVEEGATLWSHFTVENVADKGICRLVDLRVEVLKSEGRRSDQIVLNWAMTCLLP